MLTVAWPEMAGPVTDGVSDAKGERTAPKGESSNVEAGQKALYHRAKMNGLARSGEYSEDMENQAA